ncbi:hypothetical protein IQ07DRAFT_637806 [Pyrenochaeta sp. DS3sAY3a]|nr:hypothetical protein IQ07DRAFT_637806 [Pyrenochaeta sp. DS3sAY3a]
MQTITRDLIEDFVDSVGELTKDTTWQHAQLDWIRTLLQLAKSGPTLTIDAETLNEFYDAKHSIIDELATFYGKSKPDIQLQLKQIRLTRTTAALNASLADNNQSVASVSETEERSLEQNDSVQSRADIRRPHGLQPNFTEQQFITNSNHIDSDSGEELNTDGYLGDPDSPIMSPALFLEIIEKVRPELQRVREEFRRLSEE